MHHRSGHFARAQFAKVAVWLSLAFLLAGCSSPPLVTALDLPIAAPPPGTMRASPEAPKLPDAAPMPQADLVKRYASLQHLYITETKRSRTLRAYVRRVLAQKKQALKDAD